jgi:hypothetical protein
MELTYNDLIKLTLTKLKELGLQIGSIAGVHSMKKMELIKSICEAKGIVDTSKVEAEKRHKEAHDEIVKTKGEAKKLRLERDEKYVSLSDKEKLDYRKKIKVMKRKIRRLAKA